MSYLFDLALRFAVVANLALALVIPFRWGGRLILCQGVFVGLGAYVVAAGVVHWHINPLVAVGLATLTGAACGWLLTYIVARLDSATFALLTFLLAIAVMEVFENWDSITGGRNGIGNLPGFSIFGHDISRKAAVALIFSKVTGTSRHTTPPPVIDRAFCAIFVQNDHVALDKPPR